MPDFLRLISTLREQMNATLSRSDVLKPLAWLIGILTTATILMIVAKGPEWLLVLMSVLLVLIIVVYGSAYVFCLLHDRDALRSEKYSLQKMALEHGIFGDNLSGIVEQSPNAQLALLSAQKSKSEDAA